MTKAVGWVIRGVGLKMLGLVLVFAMLAGCEQSLFPDDAPRTQYDRYDQLRGRFVPEEEPGPYGVTRPALRERLSRPPQ